VNLDQLGAMVRLSKRTMERYVKCMPPPVIPASVRRGAFWDWPSVRPWMEQEFGMILPPVFPTFNHPDPDEDDEP
jgi:hypothetical protein